MNRRGFLSISAAASLAGGSAYAAPAADPALALIAEYRAAGAALAAIPDDLEDDHPALQHEERVFRRICDGCPTPTTRQGAIEALRLALDGEVKALGHEDTISLLTAALGYFEAV